MKGREMNRSDDRLIVALDFPDPDASRTLVAELGGLVGFYKIGLGMIAGGGLEFAVELKQDLGKRVFLDLKLFDIGATVFSAVRGIVGLDPDFLTVHGDPHVVRAAAAARGDAATRLLAVSVITSLDRADLDESMIAGGGVAEITAERSSRAFLNGADGVICSPLEADSVRRLPGAAGKLIVTPGTRPAGAAQHDQKRTATPAEAVRCGADHIVIGRPVTQSTDPRASVQRILEELP